MNPSKVITDNMIPEMMGILTGEAKLHRLGISPGDWQTIVLSALNMVRPYLKSFSFFSEFRNGIWIFDRDRRWFRKEPLSTTFEEGLYDRVRCVMVARTIAKMVGDHDTRQWKELFLSQESELLILNNESFLVQGQSYKKAVTKLEYLPDEKLGEFMSIPSKAKGGVQENFEGLLDTLLFMCRENIKEKMGTVTLVQNLTLQVEGIRNRITTT
jgi:hypothetical protein